MSDFATYDTTNSPSGPEKPRVYALKVLEDMEILKRNGLGDSFATPVPGHLRAYLVGNDVHFQVVLNDNSVVEAMAGIYKLREALQCDKKALVQFICEAVTTGNLLAIGAGNNGVFQFDSVKNKVVVGGTTRRNYLGTWNVDGKDYVRVQADIDTDGLGSPAPTANKNGELGWTMTAGNQARIRTKPIPTGWIGGQDCFIELLVALNQAESIGNTVDMQADYTTALVGSGGHAGATTNKTQTQPSMTGGVLNGDVQRVLIPLTHNDAQNPCAIDRKVVAVVARNGSADVGPVTLLQASLLVPSIEGSAYQT